MAHLVLVSSPSNSEVYHFDDHIAQRKFFDEQCEAAGAIEFAKGEYGVYWEEEYNIDSNRHEVDYGSFIHLIDSIKFGE